MLHIRRLTLIALILHAVTFTAAAVPGAAGRYALSRHPAFLLQELPPALTSTALPLGLVPVALAAANIAGFATGKVEEPALDIGKNLLALQFPTLLSFTLQGSPDDIVFAVSANGLRLDSYGGIDLAAITGQLRTEPVRVALEDAGFVSATAVRGDRFRVDLGYWLSAVPLEVVTSESLIDVLRGLDPFASGGSGPTEYSASFIAKADLSAGSRMTIAPSFNLRRGVVVPALSLRIPVSIFHAEASASLQVSEEGDLIPSIETSWDLKYWYPTVGIGLGIAADAGLEWRGDRLSVGFALRNVISAWSARGVQLPSPDASGADYRATEFRARPIPVMAAAFGYSAGAVRTHIAMVTEYNGTLGGALSYVAQTRERAVVIGAGYDGGPMIGFGLGFEVRGFYVEPSFELRTEPLTRQAAAGLSVQLARAKVWEGQ